jgi:hypothetical protein
VLKGVTFPDTGSTPPREGPMSEVTQRFVLVQSQNFKVVAAGGTWDRLEVYGSLGTYRWNGLDRKRIGWNESRITDREWDHQQEGN